MGGQVDYQVSLTPAERQSRYRAKDVAAANRRWRDWSMSPQGTVTVLLNYARDRARREGLPFDLSREFVRKKLDRGVCELSGIGFRREPPGRHKTHPYAPSLDRVTPALGYVESNVRLLCFAVNRARSDWGDDVLLAIAAALAGHLPDVSLA